MKQPLALNDIRDFHTDVLNIRAAGIPMDLPSMEGVSSHGSMADRLLAVEAQAAAASAHGEDLERFVRDQQLITAEYGPALLAWHYSGRAPQTLDGLMAPTALRQGSRAAFLALLVQPTFVLGLAFCALLFVCLVLVPELNRLQRQTGQSAGPVLRLLSFVQQWQIVWMIALPVLACGGLYFFARKRRWQAVRLRYRLGDLLRDWQAAARADLLVQRGLDAERALAISDASTLNAPTKQRAAPLLAWARGKAQTTQAAEHISAEPPETIVASRRLRQAASLYAGLAQSLTNRQLLFSRARIGLTIACAVIVLLIGLSVFGPVIEQLIFIATPRPA